MSEARLEIFSWKFCSCIYLVEIISFRGYQTVPMKYKMTFLGVVFHVITNSDENVPSRYKIATTDRAMRCKDSMSLNTLSSPRKLSSNNRILVADIVATIRTCALGQTDARGSKAQPSVGSGKRHARSLPHTNQTQYFQRSRAHANISSC